MAAPGQRMVMGGATAHSGIDNVYGLCEDGLSVTRLGELTMITLTGAPDPDDSRDNETPVSDEATLYAEYRIAYRDSMSRVIRAMRGSQRLSRRPARNA